MQTHLLLRILILLSTTAVINADFVAYQAWYNPTTQQTIHEFYDLHASLAGYKDKIKQQADFVAEAKKLDALAIVEDHLGYHKKMFNQGLLRVNFKRTSSGKILIESFEEWEKRNRGIPTKYYGTYQAVLYNSAIYGLEELCTKNNITCINIEQRTQWDIGAEASAATDQTILKALEANPSKKHIFLAAGAAHIQRLNTLLDKKGYQPRKPIINAKLKTIINSPQGQVLKTFFTDMFNNTTPNAFDLDNLPDADLGTIVANQIDIQTIFSQKQQPASAPKIAIANRPGKLAPANKGRAIPARKVVANQPVKPAARRVVATRLRAPAKPATKPAPQPAAKPRIIVRKPIAKKAAVPMPKPAVVEAKKVAPKQPARLVRKPIAKKIAPAQPTAKKAAPVVRPAAPKKLAARPVRKPLAKPVQQKITPAKPVARPRIIKKGVPVPKAVVAPVVQPAPIVAPQVQPKPAQATPAELFNAIAQATHDTQAHIKIATIINQNPQFINLQDNQGNTPLMLLIKQRHITKNVRALQTAIDAILEHKPNLNLVNQEGNTALTLAVEEYSEGIMSQLLDNAVSINEFTLRNALARANDNLKGTIRAPDHMQKLQKIIAQLKQVLEHRAPQQQAPAQAKKKKGNIRFGDRPQEDVLIITPQGRGRPTPKIKGRDRA